MLFIREDSEYKHKRNSLLMFLLNRFIKDSFLSVGISLIARHLDSALPLPSFVGP